MKIDKKEYFFDIHMHSFNLSHAGLLAFINRFFLENSLSYNDLLSKKLTTIIWQLVKGKIKKIPGMIATSLKKLPGKIGRSIGSLFRKKKDKNKIEEQKGRMAATYINLLSIFENDLARQFRYLELDYLSLNKNFKKVIDNYSKKDASQRDPRRFYQEIGEIWKDNKGIFEIGESPNKNIYKKVILTPLLMDFQYKGFEKLDREKVHYNLPPRKNIVDQFTDIVDGIREYLKSSSIKLFEIYPFMGINPANYELEPKCELKCRLDMSAVPGLENYFYYIRHVNVLVHYRSFDLYEYVDNNGNKVDVEAYLQQLLNSDPQKLIKGSQADVIEDVKKINNTLQALKNEHISEFIEETDKDSPAYILRGCYKSNKLVKMLYRYFGEYVPTLEAFHEHNPFFSHDESKKYPDSRKNIGCFFFSGIKLYPPLGFKTWPEEDNLAFIKTNFLYQFCQEREIPITTHCSDGGFKVITGKLGKVSKEELAIEKERIQKIASPENWIPVLETYKNLKVNFAHSGNEATYGKERWDDWTNTILCLIWKYPNVYMDLSDVGDEDKKYLNLLKQTKEFIEQSKIYDPDSFYEKLKERVLFGTDFMMNLLHVKSNFDYLVNFIETSAFKKEINKITNLDKNMLCNENPRRFLFKSDFHNKHENVKEDEKCLEKLSSG